MSQFGFYFDSSKCTGCKTCQVACKETYKLPVNNLYRHVYSYGGGSWAQNENGTYVPQDVFTYHVSIACNHCAEPACVENCPTGAMQKDEESGIVWTDHEVCIGCETCAKVCPYGAPALDSDAGCMTKCDMCKSEVEAGGKPVCVAGCPMRALDFGPIDELVAKYGEGDVEIEPLPRDTTSPSLVLAPHRDAQKSGSGTGAVLNLEEEL